MTKCTRRLIQWKPLNGITLGRGQTNSNYQLTLITEFASNKIRYKSNLELVNPDLILLTYRSKPRDLDPGLELVDFIIFLD